MYWLAPIAVFLILIFLESYKNKTIIKSFIGLFIALVVTFIIIAIDFSIKTTDTEVWSGRVVDWEHKEEWDEWHPEVCTTTTDSKGQSTTTCTPGYWEHHSAENYIKTSDNGWISVDKAPDGKKFNDSWPNEEKVLIQYWPEGTPTASSHTYVNKVQASYSIYKHKNINLKNYPGLPKYPLNTRDYIHVDRIIGDVPNKQEALTALAEANSYLNKQIQNPENPKKTKSWKQVNIIFVNLGVNKAQDWGYALQDYWEGGNKNDFIVAFSTDSDGKILWSYAFSWSEVEILKLEVQDYMNNIEQIDDFVPIIHKVKDLVAEHFVRKEFSDFNYLKIDTSTVSQIIIWILNAGITVCGIYIINNEVTSKYSFTNSRKRRSLGR